MEPLIPSLSWPISVERSSLRDGEIHVWSASLNQSPATVQKLERLLSDDERQRSVRFRFDRDQKRFAVGRGILRTLLAGCLNCAAEEIQFAYSAQGKPTLAGPGWPVRFNLAHSADVAVFALASGVDVGIDVEALRPVREMESIARRFFAPAEADRLLQLPPDQRSLGFFNCWTRKEAYLKATGAGIVGGLDQFEVSLEPGAPAALLRHRIIPDETDRWKLFDLKPATGYVGALAARARFVQVRYWQWQDANGN